MKPSILTMVIPIFFAGCLLGPDYERPTILEPEAFRNQTEEAIDTNSLAEMPWWELFQDEILQDLIRTALEENKDLRLAVARIEEARSELGITTSDLFPQVQGEGAYMRQRIPGTLFPGTSADTSLNTSSYNVGGSLSWEIDLWGQIRRATEASWAKLFASEEAQRGVTIGLISQVAQTYFELRSLDLELGITSRTLESRKAMFQIVVSRHEEGLVSGLDRAKAEAEVVKVASQIPDLERAIVQKENALSILLGQNPSSIKRGRQLTEQTTPPVIPAGLPSALLERRPDILQAEQNLVASTPSKATPSI